MLIEKIDSPLVRRGNTCKSPLLTKEGPGEVMPAEYGTVNLKRSTKLRKGLRLLSVVFPSVVCQF